MNLRVLLTRQLNVHVKMEIIAFRKYPMYIYVYLIGFVLQMTGSTFTSFNSSMQWEIQEDAERTVNEQPKAYVSEQERGPKP